MKLNITKRTIQHIVFGSIFFLSAVVIWFLLPKEEHSSFEPQIGKPWKYDDVKAEFDFPILKTDQQIKQEQDSVLKECYFYFQMDKSQLETQKKLLLASTKFSDFEKSKILSALEQIYNLGVVSIEDLDRTSGTENLCIVDQNLSRVVSVDEVLTLRGAYELAQKELFSLLNWSAISSDVANYIAPNLTFDEEMTLKMRNERFKKILPTYGLVQLGEKIIGNGELVTAEKYQILLSLQKATSSKTESSQNLLMLIGEALFIVCCLLSLVFYMLLFRPRISASN